MATIEGKRFVHGNGPTHFHVLSSGDQIECDSPYCGDTMNTDPRDLAPVIRGREPWRGR